jgi:hypothetical protein
LPQQAYYFPAYELLLDDLRDYRFYAQDMAHPTEQAIQYVWGKFSDTFFGQATLQLIQEVEAIRRAAAHRPFNPDTAAHQAFLRKQLAAIEALEQNKGIVLKNEREVLARQLT